MILARGNQKYARLRFGIGPRAEIVVPVRTDFRAPFPASDVAAWMEEYDEHVHVRSLVVIETEEATIAADQTRPVWSDEFSDLFLTGDLLNG